MYMLEMYRDGAVRSSAARQRACVDFTHVCRAARFGFLEAQRRAPLGRVANNVAEAYQG